MARTASVIPPGAAKVCLSASNVGRPGNVGLTLIGDVRRGIHITLNQQLIQWSDCKIGASFEADGVMKCNREIGDETS